MELAINRRLILSRSTILLIALLCLLVQSGLVLADGFGGLASEKFIGRSGVANSQLLIGRNGVGDSSLDDGLAPIELILSATGVSMDASGTIATLNGNLSDLNGFPNASVWFEWGYTANYGNSTATQAATATGNYSANIQHFDPDRIIFYRFAGQTDGLSYSSGSSFDPSGIATATYRIGSLLPFILLVVFILGALGIAFFGGNIGVGLIVVMVIILISVVGVDSLQLSLQSLW